MKKQPVSSLKSKALRMLATREHSRVELKRKLEAKAEEGDDVEAVLDRMSKRAFSRTRVLPRVMYVLVPRGWAPDVCNMSSSSAV